MASDDERWSIGGLGRAPSFRERVEFNVRTLLWSAVTGESVVIHWGSDEERETTLRALARVGVVLIDTGEEGS